MQRTSVYRLLPLVCLIAGMFVSCAGNPKKPAVHIDAQHYLKAFAADSIGVAQLRGQRQVWQCYRGMTIDYFLVDVSGAAPRKLDSVSTYQAIDLYKQPPLHYNWQKDWFVVGESESGTGIYNQRMTYVRPERKKLRVLMRFNTWSSMLGVESNPMPYESTEISLVHATKEKMAFSAEHRSGVHTLDSDYNVTGTIEQQHLSDKAVFVYDPVKKRFRFSRNNEPSFRGMWKEIDESPDR